MYLWFENAEIKTNKILIPFIFAQTPLHESSNPVSSLIGLSMQILSDINIIVVPINISIIIHYRHFIYNVYSNELNVYSSKECTQQLGSS